MSDDFNNDSLMELYLYESTSLLESLDDILLDAEAEQNLSQENVNEIFRIMHTIKGSSAMMEYKGIAEVAHKTEDMFSFIRDSGLKHEYVAELFDSVLAVSDFLKVEIEKVQDGKALDNDTEALTATLINLTSRIKECSDAPAPKIDVGRSLGGVPSSTPTATPEPVVKQPEPVVKQPEPVTKQPEPVQLATPEPIARQPEPVAPQEEKPKIPHVSLDADISKVSSRVSGGNTSLNGPTTYFIHVHFNEGSKMENIRAFMLANKLGEKGTVNKTIPTNLEGSQTAAAQIVERGLYISYTSTLFREQIEALAKGTLSVESVAFVRKLPEDLDSGFEDEEIESTAPAPRPEVTADSTPQQQEEAPSSVQEQPAPVDQVAMPQEVAPAPQETVAPTPEPVAPVEQPTAPVESAPQPEPSTKPQTAPSDSGLSTQMAATHNQNAHAKQSIISVDLKKLDTLLDLVGEIVINESIVSENPDLEGLELTNFRKATRQLGKLTNELQDTVMSIRMLPVSIVFQRMRRIVRDMSKSLDKDVDLILSGESTEVDKTILDAMSDPIMHLVRNAMDHAIEPKEERLASGKNSKGHIILSAQNSGGDVIISISDDGKGLDRSGILAKARSKGLLRKPEEEYSTKEIYNLLMAPGFSTKEAVTEYSGRGVGLDVVKSNIEKIGGTVIIESRKGQGTNIMLKIPLTLAIISCMQIRLGKNVYSIPITNIKESFKADAGQLVTDPVGNEMIMLRGSAYPICRLYEIYDEQSAIREIDNGILVLVDSGEKQICLLADSLIGKFQVVVKPLPNYLKRFNIKSTGISGCTIMGNGNISLIMNVQELT